MKTRTSILIESEILKQAQKIGINVSAFTEYALTQTLNQIQNLSFSRGFLSEKEKVECGRRDLNPGRQRGKMTSVDWDGFRDWLLRNHKPHTVVSMVSYAKQYAHLLESFNLSDLLTVRETLRPNILKALSSLAKYLGVYEEYKKALRNYGLAWGGKQADQLLIERLTKVNNPDEVWHWVKQVKMAREELADFLDFMALTGLRLEEAVNSYNLIIKLAKKGNLNEYYNKINSCLEHFKFKEIFIRRSKKAFVSFIPEELVSRISDNPPLKNKFGIQKRVKLANLKLRFADIREAHASVLTRHLSPSEIDFLHGRIGTSVFMQNYFNPALISDLKQRVFKAIAEIETKIS